jgi:ATP-dependent protease ClpP protease subunit
MTDHSSEPPAEDPVPSPTVVTGIVQHIWCSVGISKKMEDVLTGFILNQAQNSVIVSEYVVYLTTTGGSPVSAANLYNFFKSLPQKTTVYNMGNVSSAGVLFFLGFENRYGVPDCTFLIHPTTLPKSLFPEQLSVFDLQTQKQILETLDEMTHTTIEKETKGRATKALSTKEIQDAMAKTTVYHAEEAIEYGLIDKIERPTLPAASVLYINDQWLATQPG